MFPRWVDRHSINCSSCGELVDERECQLGPGGVGGICPACEKATEKMDRVDDLDEIDCDGGIFPIDLSEE